VLFSNPKAFGVFAAGIRSDPAFPRPRPLLLTLARAGCSCLTYHKRWPEPNLPNREGPLPLGLADSVDRLSPSALSASRNRLEIRITSKIVSMMCSIISDGYRRRPDSETEPAFDTGRVQDRPAICLSK